MSATPEKTASFGEFVREKRIQRGLSLRRFAELIGLSPTYVSQIENGVQSPPTLERARRMAQVLGEAEDVLIVMAGRIPEDVSEILQEQPEEIANFIRETRGLSREQLVNLMEEARRIKRARTARAEERRAWLTGAAREKDTASGASQSQSTGRD